MSHVGRGKALLVLGVVWAVCLTSAGCVLNVSLSDAPTPPKDVQPDKPDKPDTTAKPPAPDPLLQVGLDQAPKAADLPGDSTGHEGRPDPLAQKPRHDGDKPDASGSSSAPALPAPLHGPNSGDVPPLPREKQMTSLPPYIVEPPDILLISAVRLIPRPPYRIEPLDILTLQVSETLPNQPIVGLYPVQPDGTIALGFTYGVVRIAGMTLEDAQKAIREHLERRLKMPQVVLGLAQFRGLQQIAGEHLVRQDGTVSLGTYGCVYVAGLNLEQTRFVIEQYLSQFLLDPQISVDVFAYNSKAYYVIADGAGYGQAVFKFPITGNETVLDAINNIGGIPAVGSKRRMWVARPAPANHECLQILPVDWLAIVQGGATRTNYQLFPGDRVYIKADPFILVDNVIAKVVAPIERILGVTLLGSSLIRTFQNNNGTRSTNGGFIVTGF
jgi:polysaccharide export outer membrane protein